MAALAAAMPGQGAIHTPIGGFLATVPPMFGALATVVVVFCRIQKGRPADRLLRAGFLIQCLCVALPVTVASL